jgi:N-glycosylase/DNA lyase
MGDIASIRVTDFDLERTLNSGQVFHWVRSGNGFAGAIGDIPMFVAQEGDRFFFPKGSRRLVCAYFALDHELTEIIQTFPKDDTMQAAVLFCPGLRIIRQPIWECLATFITSALKQVRHISAISLSIRKRFGIRLGESGVCSYPEPVVLAKLELKQLLECQLGFRAKNLLETAKRIAASAVDLEVLKKLPTEEARTILCELPGVGEKIANCVLLFAYERLDVVPIDVWIKRILETDYLKGSRSQAELKQFSADYFGPYAGYAQQYLFHHRRATSMLRGLKGSSAGHVST